jgi:hypothetical protein
MNYYNSETLLEQQKEIDKLTAERDALAAQVDVLGDKLSEVVALLDFDGMTAVQWLLDNCQEIEQLTNLEPEECLAHVRAEAVDDVWKKLHHRWKPDTDGDSAFVRVSEIKEMAERIRQGGQK